MFYVRYLELEKLRKNIFTQSQSFCMFPFKFNCSLKFVMYSTGQKKRLN